MARTAFGNLSAAAARMIRQGPRVPVVALDPGRRAPYSTSSRVDVWIIVMVATDPRGSLNFAELAPQILTPLRRLRDVAPPEMAAMMGMSTRAYQDFEKGRTGLLLDRIRLFAEILKLDQFAILAAFFLGKPGLALAFAHNKFMLIQASAVDEFDEETQQAIAAVDPLTMLDAHIQFYAQVAEHGRRQLQAADGRRPKA